MSLFRLDASIRVDGSASHARRCVYGGIPDGSTSVTAVTTASTFTLQFCLNGRCGIARSGVSFSGLLGSVLCHDSRRRMGWPRWAS